MGGNGDQKRTHILIVQSDPIEQARLGVIAQSLGLSGHLLSDPIQALEAISFSGYLLILMGIDSHSLESLALVQTLKVNCLRAGRATPIIGIIDRDFSLEERNRLVSMGISDFLTKPAKLDDFQDILWRWIPAVA